MDDDEDIQSQASDDSGSPVSTRSNGRISVTVASHAPSQKNLTLALPIQQPQHSRPAGNGGGGREDCWSEGATAVLIDAWGERYIELSRGNLKQKDWKDVSDVVCSREDYTKVPKTDIQCKNRIDTVKKKYKMEKAKLAAGNGPSKWLFYQKLDQLIGSTAKIGSPAAGSGGRGGSSAQFQPSQRVPTGIPIGLRSGSQSARQQQQSQQQQQQNPPFRKRFRVNSDMDFEPEVSVEAESADEYPAEKYERKRPRNQSNFDQERVERNRGNDREKENGTEKGNSVRELARAIMKFGEVYEQAESSKLKQLVDMEKQRMKFAKELEMQRMQFFMKTQMEISRMNHRKIGNGRNHRSVNNTANNMDNHSESSD